MDAIKAFFSNAWDRIKTTLPGVIQNYPFASGALFLVGVAAGAIVF